MSAPHVALAARVLAELRAQLATGPLQAVTVWQPWSWAILEAGKPAENRSWALPQRLWGKWVGLHAGVGGGGRQLADESQDIRDVFKIKVPPDLPRRVLVGLVKFSRGYPLEQLPRPRTEWDCGPWCWEVADRLAFSSTISISGAQGFWFVPAAETSQLLLQLAAAAGEPAAGPVGCSLCGAPAIYIRTPAGSRVGAPACGACCSGTDLCVPLAALLPGRLAELARHFPAGPRAAPIRDARGNEGVNAAKSRLSSLVGPARDLPVDRPMVHHGDHPPREDGHG